MADPGRRCGPGPDHLISAQHQARRCRSVRAGEALLEYIAVPSSPYTGSLSVRAPWTWCSSCGRRHGRASPHHLAFLASAPACHTRIITTVEWGA